MGSYSNIDRRKFLNLAGVTAGALAVSPLVERVADAQIAWNAGEVVHLVPAVSHDRLLIKASLKMALDQPPELRVGDRSFAGVMTDTERRFWMFDVPGLAPSTRYNLQIVSARGPLCDPWPLKTFPPPGSRPDRLRILAYTCAGGYDGPPLAGKTFWLDMAARRRLLDRGLSYEPDVVIANGDHIYWDQETTLNKPKAQADHIVKNWWGRFGKLDWEIPILGTKNEQVLKAIADYQIAGLYGVKLRSTPSFFLTDDHDEFENDEFTDELATMPASEFGLNGEDATQFLYYPEFLPDARRPAYLWGTGKSGRAAGTNQFFGTLRYGDLLEAVFYDCRRFADYKGVHARLIPRWTEDWLIRRTLAEDTAHFIHVPSLPFAYTSGKLGDWYPDVLGQEGRMVLYKPKLGWQQGWLAQHQRLVEALAGQQHRRPVILQGDFHATAAGQMKRVADLDLAKNPVGIVMGGTLGTGDYAFPSSVRKIASSPSELVTMDEVLPATEKNGFSIIDVTPEKMTFRLFMWRPPEAVAAIDDLQPVLSYEVTRGS
jgi:hypothetical protein